MGNDLSRGLGVGLSVELDEDGVDLFILSGSEFGLHGLNLGDQSVEFGATPFDRVDLLADEAKLASAVGRTHLVGDPARGKTAVLGIAGHVGSGA